MGMHPADREAWVRTLKAGDRVIVLHRSTVQPPTVETVAFAELRMGRPFVRLTNGAEFRRDGFTKDREWRLFPVDTAEGKYLLEKHERDALLSKIARSVRHADLPTLRLVAGWLDEPST